MLYWLSKHGFECARIDHTGIDLIARNPVEDRPMGISVKSSCRLPTQEEKPVTIYRADLDKAKEACRAFGCTPYLGVVVDTGPQIHGMLVRVTTVERFNPNMKKTFRWGMSAPWRQRYSENDDIKTFAMECQTPRWWSPWQCGPVRTGDRLMLSSVSMDCDQRARRRRI